MGDMVHDMLVDRPPSPARMEYRSDKHARSVQLQESPPITVNMWAYKHTVVPSRDFCMLELSTVRP